MSEHRVPTRGRRRARGLAAVAAGVGMLVFAAAGCGGGDSADVPAFEARDAALKTGMQEGMSEGFDRLDEYLATMA